jgi:cytochrome b561
MAYAIAIVAGFAGAGLGWIAAGLTAAAILAALGMPPTSGLPDTFHLLNQLGAMAGFLLAIGLALRLSGRARSMREGAQSSLVIAAALAVIFAAGSNLRLSAMEHLGLNAGARSIEFEIRLPPVVATGSSKREAQVELHTDLNQTIALLRSGDWSATDDGRAILRGTVPIEFRTAQRTLVLNMPGQPQRLFKIRLAANPSRSTEFSPWHLVDSTANARGERERAMVDDNFAIRYRVI